MLFSRLMLYPAVFCLGAGIFIGAVWANVSWGRYWAWDPKEVWALISFLIYGAAFHGPSLAVFRQPGTWLDITIRWKPKKNNRKALDYYLQYIEYNPKDTDTLLHIGLIYESGLGDSAQYRPRP